MTDTQPSFTFDRVVRIGVTVALCWALLYTVQYLSDVLVPFVIAFLLAYLMNPLVCLVQKKIPQRALAVAISVSCVAALMCALSSVCVYMIVAEAAHFADLLRALAHDGWSDNILAIIPQSYAEDVRQALTTESLRTVLTSDGMWAYVTSSSTYVLPWVQGVGAGMMSILGLSVIVLYTVFILIDYQWFIRHWSHVIPPKNRGDVQAFLGDFDSAMNRHFRAQALISAITGGLFIIGFMIIGLPMAIFFGIFVGVLNMVPYVQIVALIPAAVLALIQSLEGGSGVVSNMLYVLGVFVVVQIIQDGFIVPPIMGKAFGLRPVVILLSIMIWGKLLGVLGLIIALPLTCLAWAWYQRLVIQPQEQEAQTTAAEPAREHTPAEA